MKRIGKVVVLLVILLFLLVGCKSIGEASRFDVSDDEIIEEADVCISGWQCISKWKKSYLQEDCNWTDETECILGCVNGTCRKGKTCDSGWSCIDGSKFGFLTEACLWINVKKCEGGCINEICLQESNKTEFNNSKINTGTKITKEEVPVEQVFTLYQNVITVGEINGERHNLSIYLLEAGRAKIKMDDEKSDWLADGESFTYGNELTITLKEILFQPYPGGTRTVTYTIS